MTNLNKRATKLEKMFNETNQYLTIEQSCYGSDDDNSIWFNVNMGNLDINICLDEEGYYLETKREYDEDPKNLRNVKSEKAVINYIERFI